MVWAVFAQLVTRYWVIPALPQPRGGFRTGGRVRLRADPSSPRVRFERGDFPLPCRVGQVERPRDPWFRAKIRTQPLPGRS
jgi:hypothetical protein